MTPLVRHIPLLISGLMALMTLAPIPAWCQSTGVPDPDVLLQTWHRTQHEASAALGPVSVTEHMVREIDAPRGLLELETRASLTGIVGETDWTREFYEGRRNGRTLSGDQLERLDNDPPRFLQPPPVMPPFLFSDRALRRLRPSSDPVPDVVDDHPAWRFDLTSTTPPPPPPGRPRPPHIERITVWFSRSPQLEAEPAPRLLRSRTLLHFPGPGNRPQRVGPSVQETAYTRFEGLDVPVHARLEGLLQQKRRIRTFTVLFTIDRSFTGYRQAGA